MPFRFRKSLKILPGLKINLSKSGISTSIGGPGHSLNLGKQGLKTTVGLPGTGLSYSSRVAAPPPATSQPTAQPGSSKSGGSGGGCLVGLLTAIVEVLGVFFQAAFFLLKALFSGLKWLWKFITATPGRKLAAMSVLAVLSMLFFACFSINLLVAAVFPAPTSTAIPPTRLAAPTQAAKSQVLELPTVTQPATPTSTDIPLPSSTPLPEPTPTATLVAQTCPPANAPAQNGTVLDIVDGATLRVLIDGATYTVKYLGLNCPAAGAYYAAESKQKSASLVYGKKVTLLSGSVDKDANGALLRYVLDENNLFLNQELLQQGYLSLDPAFSETDCLLTYQVAQQSAQLSSLGQWGAPPTAIILAAPTSDPFSQPPLINNPPTTNSGSCCKVCGSDSQPCGNSCISLNKTCHQPPGCACK